ncbi:MAG TPA: signal recognition particle protein Srp54 [Candidatus Nanoarchaeia archaeon]|nr:signal recognition particle protein Srp54 [Candidatus Nanoarchaeia archaeon]
MVLDKLSTSLKDTLSKIAKSIFVDDTIINELVKDIQRALLQSDVNVELVFTLTNAIKQRAKEPSPPGLTKKEQLVNIVYEELTNFLGKEPKEIKILKKPTKIMLVGLFGNGKTTTAGKLGKFYKKRGHRVALIQTDTWRPAAYDQLQQLASQIGADFYGNKKSKNPSDIYKEHQEKLNEYDVVIVDTAGRDALNDELIKELNDINTLVQPDERLLVISADIGQTAQKQAETFHSTVNVTGVIITKMDGTARGGGALSACSVTKAPVAFIGVGEKIDELEPFNPKRFVSRLLGMGDIETLLEKAKEAVSEDKAEDLGKRFMSGKFTLLDLYDQMEAMKSMGTLSKLVDMIPGFSQLKIPKEALAVQEEKLKKWKIVMNSMTQQELEDPDVLSKTRIDRIAKGSGTSDTDIKELLKQYTQAKKMGKMLQGGRNMKRMMKKFGGQLPEGFDPSMMTG